MILAIVVGTVVGTRRADGLDAPRYLLVDPCNQHGVSKQAPLVALDPVGARRGDMVLLSQGSSTRQTSFTDNKPLDALIVGIVEMVSAV